MILTFFKAINAGVIIGIGGTCFLAIPDKTIGAFMFAVGLLTICVTDQYLFTGKCSYTYDVKYLLTVILGNCIGATGFGLLMGLLNYNAPVRAVEMCEIKLAENIKVVPLAILCNILIYFAVEGFKKGQTILLIMCVMVFILCGFEHSIANMFYFAVAKKYTWDSVLYLLLNVVSNWVGGVIVLLGRKYNDEHCI